MKRLLQFSISLFSIAAFGQAEFIDTTFGTHNGYSLIDTSPFELGISAILQHNGSIYGMAQDFTSNTQIIKTDMNGILDTSFGTNGVVDLGSDSFSAFWKPSNVLSLTADEKLLVVTHANWAGSSPDYLNMVTKLNLDGTLDTSYGTYGHLYSTFPYGFDPVAVYKSPTDELIIVGKNGQPDGEEVQNLLIIKVGANGVVDTTFGDNGLMSLDYDHTNYDLHRATVSDQNAYLLFTRIPFGDSYMAKVDLATGAYDLTFGDNGQKVINHSIETETSHAFMVDADQNLYVTGHHHTIDGVAGSYLFYIYKYAPDGSLATDFGVNGIVEFEPLDDTPSVPTSFSLKQHGDRLLVLGHIYVWDAENYERTLLMQFDLAGNRDSEFGNNGIIINPLFTSMDLAYDYIIDETSIMTCGSCPGDPSPQSSCYVKYLKSGTLSTADLGKPNVIIYPSPVTNILTFATTEVILKAEIFDMSGRIVTTIAVNGNQADLSMLSSGSYILKLYGGDGVFVNRVLKE